MSGQVWIGSELPEITALKARIAELEGERDAHKAKNDVTSVGISALIHVYEAADRLAEECDEDTWEVEEVRMRDLHSALERYEEIAENGGEVCGPITQLTAERDNALRYTELLIQERDNAKSKELEVLRLRIAELEGERDAAKAEAEKYRTAALRAGKGVPHA
jgi:chromosome segregation ATPase